jgi:cytochrome b6-f complex iron-sulfur subunit
MTTGHHRWPDNSYETMSEPEEPEVSRQAGEVSRRDFFSEMTLVALGIAGLGAVAVTYQYLSPNVLFEPSPTFRAGTPDLFPLNSVTYLQDQQVYIVRTADGFYAISAVCTHLGCITQWKLEADQIQCPCHGSKFKSDGTKIEGPAPQPLPHFAISLTSDGELLVDKMQSVKPGQILKV